MARAARSTAGSSLPITSVAFPPGGGQHQISPRPGNDRNRPGTSGNRSLAQDRVEPSTVRTPVSPRLGRSPAHRDAACQWTAHANQAPQGHGPVAVSARSDRYTPRRSQPDKDHPGTSCLGSRSPPCPREPSAAATDPARTPGRLMSRSRLCAPKVLGSSGARRHSPTPTDPGPAAARPSHQLVLRACSTAPVAPPGTCRHNLIQPAPTRQVP
jgi:hypothetical protein